MDILIVLISLLFGAFISYFILNKKLTASNQKNIQLETTLNEKEKNFLEKLQLVDQLKSQVNSEFKNIASEILKTDRDKLKVDNSDLLNPLQTQLKSFRERIETITKEQVEERTSLKEQIKSLHEANIETRQSAQNLTNALTYDNKQQGDWGEEILNSLLLSYGFREGVEFDLQKQYKNEMGERFKPDVILHLPEGKDVVIDSKVSLKDYADYIADQANEAALKKHIASIENQIKNISIKEYENLEGVKSLDFIFVFIPIEGALLLALQYRPNLFDDALKKNIMLVSPSMLSMSLKTVNFMWQTDKQNKNADEIARQAGKMYDKLAGFFNDLDKIENQFDKTKEGFSDVRKKLQTGPGNLIGRAEKLKALGVKSNKEINE
ncbi:MAG: DNA recombination protein RmuC [Gammaproteobacteria bacterium]|nr:DNA recombination protein RmuC [Gammaproteobacteria bacterium]